MIIVPQEELTLTDKKEFCNRALESGFQMAEDKSLGSRNQLAYRHAEVDVDFGTTPTFWQTQTLAAVPGPYTVFAGVAGVALVPQLANNIVAVFYKAIILSVPNPFAMLHFGLGPAAGAPVTTMGHVDLEQLEGYMTMVGFLSEPMVYAPQDWVNIAVENKINTAAQEALVLSCYIIGTLSAIGTS
jgi:hypothetical protein